MTKPIQTPADRTFLCPIDCLPGVSEVFGGQYLLPAGVTVNGTPRVLDIGANCGAFSLLARMLWPGCHVTAYEPQADIFAHLHYNLTGLPNVEAVNAAVGDPNRTLMLPGLENRLCSGQYDLGEQSRSVEPKTITVVAPWDLPPADIIKLDAEGAEAFIMEQINYHPSLLLLEWHGLPNRRRVEIALEGKMRLIASRSVALERGIYIFAKL